MTAQNLSYLMRYLMIPMLVILVWILVREALVTLRRAMRRTIQPARDVFLLGETTAGEGLLNLPIYSMTTIGRTPSCDVRLRDPSIAARHAMIYLFDGEWFLRPLGRSPVSINGVRIHAPTPLEDQDEITLGERCLSFIVAPEYTRLMAEREAWANAAIHGTAAASGFTPAAGSRPVPTAAPARYALFHRPTQAGSGSGSPDGRTGKGPDGRTGGGAGGLGGLNGRTPEGPGGPNHEGNRSPDPGVHDDDPDEAYQDILADETPDDGVAVERAPAFAPPPPAPPLVQRLPALAWLLYNLLMIGGLGISLLLIPDAISVVSHSVALWYFGFFLAGNLYLAGLPRLLKGLDPVLLLCFLLLTGIGLIIQTRLAIPESLVVREAVFAPGWIGRLSADLEAIGRSAAALFGSTPAAAPVLSPETLSRVQAIFGSLNAQYLSIAIGLALVPPTALFVARTRLVELFIPLCAILTPLLLVTTLVLGNGADSHGATLWINIGGFSMQLTEFAKITYLIVVAGFFKNRPSIRMQLFFASWAGLVFFLIMLLPDLGSAMILLPTTLLVYVVMTSEYLTTLLLLAGGTGVGALAYAIFPHVQRRIVGWTTLWTQVNDSNRQIVYGLQAMVRGGLLGRGLGNGSPGGIPLASSDMIFSVVAEELGLVTGLAIVLVFIVIWLRATTTTVLAPDGFRSSLTLAIGTMLFVEAVVVIAGTTGLMPLTGATLPMIARGGSSALAKLLLLGILLGLTVRPRERRVRA